MFEVIVKPLTSFIETVNDLNAHYDALSYDEQKAMTIIQRVRYYNWTFELCCLGLVAVMFVCYKVGVSTNVSTADKIFNSLHVYFKHELNFARVGLTSLKAGTPKLYLDQHLHSWFTSFATGRSAIACINVKVHLMARNNFVALFVEYLIGYFFPTLAFEDLEEYCEVIISPNGIHVASESATVNGNAKDILNNFKFVNAIVNKNIMNKVREEKYYLSLTQTSENDKLPNEYVFMSEINQLNDFIFKYVKPSFNEEILTKSTNLLQYISFTDLPDAKPETVKELASNVLEPRCVIHTNVPKNATELALLNGMIGSMVEVIDNFTRDLVQKSTNVAITADILRKINNLRQQEIDKIDKLAKKAALEKAMEEKKEVDKEKRRELKKSGNFQNDEQKMKEKRERRARNRQKSRM